MAPGGPSFPGGPGSPGGPWIPGGPCENFNNVTIKLNDVNIHK